MHLFLIGFRGSGKSTVGSLLADLICLPFCDLDRLIQSDSGRNIAEIFRELGEASFREMETRLLAKVVAESSAVISLGGGACLAEKNRSLIKACGRTIWLRAEPETLWNRIQNDPQSSSTRPALTLFDGLDEVRRLLELRESTYTACADYVIDSDTVTPLDAATEIAGWWRDADK